MTEENLKAIEEWWSRVGNKTEDGELAAIGEYHVRGCIAEVRRLQSHFTDGEKQLIETINEQAEEIAFLRKQRDAARRACESAVASEREACAKIAKDRLSAAIAAFDSSPVFQDDLYAGEKRAARDIEAAIRARGGK